jgi:DNA invertase Pin-like site-specific DNA recombinase
MPIIAYYRASTDKQGRSGLGLDAQREALRTYAEKAGPLLAEYCEIESGRRNDRPELEKALAHARRSKATLVVAKLDRLARSVAFTSTLMDSGADFVACDNPHANRFTIHILAAVAEHEAMLISERTKVALAAAKRRGTLLGSARPGHWHGREEIRVAATHKAAEVAGRLSHEAAQGAYTDLLPIVAGLRAIGMTFRAIAAHLTAMGHTTRRGCAWNGSQVLRVIRDATANSPA